MIALFNFSTSDQVAYTGESEEYQDLLTKKKVDPVQIFLPAHGYVWLYKTV